MRNLFIATTLFVLSLLTGCNRSNIESPDLNKRLLTIKAAMPSQQNSTKVSLTQNGKDIDLTWQAGDQIQLCFIQGENKYKKTSTVSNISDDYKSAEFQIEIPTEITSGTFDLYGVYGGQGLFDADYSTAVLPSLNIHPGNLNGLQDGKYVMLQFGQTGISVVNPSVNITFEHIGSIFCIKLKNTSNTVLSNLYRAELNATSNGWAYNTGSGGAKYSLPTATFADGSSSDNLIAFNLPSAINLLAEGIAEFWGWYPPVPSANWPQLNLSIHNSTSSQIAISANNKPARTTATAVGKCYYFYAIWDGTALNFSDNQFSVPTIESLTITGDLMHAAKGSNEIGIVYSKEGKVYYNAAKSAGVWSGEEELGAGSEARIAMDGDGHPHIVFRTSDNKIAYISHNGTVWGTPAYITSTLGNSCYYPDIAVDGNGYAHITYTDVKGNTGAYTDQPDIMYAVNSSGSFVKTLIYNGFVDNYGGADWGREFYNKGSLIALDGSGNYYIMAHLYSYDSWMGGSSKIYKVVFKTSTASGSSTGSTSDQHQIYDLRYNGSNVVALYMSENTQKASTLSVSGNKIMTTDFFNISASATLSSYFEVSSNKVVGGKTVAGNNLFTKYNDFENTYSDVVVKGTKVVVTEVGGLFYVVYTDNADGKIKIKKVKTS